jgi:glucokinase
MNKHIPGAVLPQINQLLGTRYRQSGTYHVPAEKVVSVEGVIARHKVMAALRAVSCEQERQRIIEQISRGE